MKTAFRLLLVLVMLTGATATAAVWWADRLWREPGPLAQPVSLVAAPGEGARTIADKLAAAGVIDKQQLFLVILWLSGDGARLQAGEYRFRPGVSMQATAAQMIAGRVVVRQLTLPEGVSTARALALIAAAEGLQGDSGAAAEGALLPETYHYGRGDRRAALLARMQSAMRATVAQLWAARAADLPLKTPAEAVILASIIEKETGLAAERARVAGVFVNRLRRGMRLQSDPTVIYALTRGEAELARPLAKSDLAVDSPYNTYRYPGLPPGPIANPGRAAIAAALNPAKTDALYFVADGKGGHAFARTLAEHNRNVRRWRKLRRAAPAEQTK